jgi:hypothetical protein
MVVVAAIALFAQPVRAQSANPLADGARHTYAIVKDCITRAAEKMPEASYTFQPTPDVRSFGQLVGHLADANAALCSTRITISSSYGNMVTCLRLKGLVPPSSEPARR